MNSETRTNASAQQRAVQIIESYIAAMRPGDRISKAELVAQHPDLAVDLESCLESLEFLHSPQNTDSMETGPGVPIPTFDAEMRQVGEYLLVREIGRGGMGMVYEAVQPALARRVALKILPYGRTLDTRQLLRFKNESLAAARLDHPNIVRVISVGHERGMHYYAMQYVEGDSLAVVLAKLRKTSPRHDDSTHYAALSHHDDRSLDDTPADDTHSAPTLGDEFFRRVANWGLQAADALDHAHAVGVIHRDIKPSNLLLDASGRVLIADFGVALMQNSPELTETGDLLGTARYMSPEQWQGRPGLVDHRTDIYSLGATLYELLTLRPAFQGEDRQQLQRLITDEPPVPPRNIVKSIPLDLETIVLKAMAKDRDDRYASGEEMADDLRRFLREQPIRARRPTLLQRGLRWSRKHALVVAAGVLFLVLATAGLSVSTSMILFQRNRAEQAAKASDDQRRKAEIETARALESKRRWKELYDAGQIRAAFSAWQTGNVTYAERALKELQPMKGQPDNRGIEWYLLKQRLRDYRHRLAHHKDEVYCAAYSQDGRWLATGGKEGKVCVSDTRSGELRLVIDELGNTDVNGLAFRDDGRQLATASEDGQVRLFNAETGELETILNGDRQGAFAVHYAQGGELLISAGRSGIVRLWDVPSGDRIGEFPAHDSQVESLDVSADGSFLATAGRDDVIRLWDLPACIADRDASRPLHVFRGHRDTVLTVAFSPDGDRLVSGGEDYTVFIWDVPNREVLHQMQGHDEWVQGVAFSTDGRMAISASKDATVRLWDAATGKSAGTLRGHRGRVWSIAVSPDGDTLATAGADSTVKIWPWSAAQPFAACSASGEEVTSLAVNPDGHLAATVDAEGKVVLRDVVTGRELRSRHFKAPGWNSILFAADGTWLFLADGQQHVHVLEARTLKSKWELGKCDLPIEKLCLHPTEQLLVALGSDRIAKSALYIWRLDEPSTGPKTVDVQLARSNCFDFHPAGDWIALGQQRGEIALINWKALLNGKPNVLQPTWQAHLGPVSSVCFSPDGVLLASASHDGLVSLWSCPDGILIDTLHGYSSSVSTLAFSHDGRTLASGGSDGVLRLWNVNTSQELVELATVEKSLREIAFLPNRRGLLAITNSDGEHSLLGWFTDHAAWPHPLDPSTSLSGK